MKEFLQPNCKSHVCEIGIFFEQSHQKRRKKLSQALTRLLQTIFFCCNDYTNIRSGNVWSLVHNDQVRKPWLWLGSQDQGAWIRLPELGCQGQVQGFRFGMSSGHPNSKVCRIKPGLPRYILINFMLRICSSEIILKTRKDLNIAFQKNSYALSFLEFVFEFHDELKVNQVHTQFAFNQPTTTTTATTLEPQHFLFQLCSAYFKVDQNRHRFPSYVKAAKIISTLGFHLKYGWPMLGVVHK